MPLVGVIAVENDGTAMRAGVSTTGSEQQMPRPVAGADVPITHDGINSHGRADVVDVEGQVVIVITGREYVVHNSDSCRDAGIGANGSCAIHGTGGTRTRRNRALGAGAFEAECAGP